MNPTSLIDQEPKEHTTLISHHPPAAFFPARGIPLLANQMACGSLYPLRLYAGHTTGKDTGRLHNLACQYPGATASTQGRARMDIKTDITRALIELPVLGTIADI